MITILLALIAIAAIFKIRKVLCRDTRMSSTTAQWIDEDCEPL